MITLRLPHPPSVNHYWVHTNTGKHYIAGKGKQFRQDVFGIVREIRGTSQPIVGGVALYVDWYPPDARKRDIDNILKALLDALQYAGLYKDDNQIVRLSVTRYGPIKDGMVCVMCDDLSQPPGQAKEKQE